MALDPLTAGIGLVKSWFEGRDKKNQRVHAEAMEDGKRITAMDDNDAAYAIQNLKENTSTWKDEVALITLLIPAWICFMRWEDFFGASFDGPAIVTAGFQALATAPMWYQSLLTLGISGALGVNEYAKHKKRSRLSVVKEAREK